MFDILHAMNTLADKFHANHGSNANQQGDKGNGIDKLCWTTVQFNTMGMISFLRHCKALWYVSSVKRCGQLMGLDPSLNYDSEKVSCLKATRFQIQARHLEILGKTNKRFTVAWLSFAFPLLIFILGLAFNYIIVLLKSYDAAYKKVVKEIPVWKKRGCSVKVLLACVQTPSPQDPEARGEGSVLIETNLRMTLTPKKDGSPTQWEGIWFSFLDIYYARSYRPLWVKISSAIQPELSKWDQNLQWDCDHAPFTFTGIP